MKLHIESGYRGAMLCLGMDLRGFTARDIAQATGLKLKIVTSFMAGSQPGEDELKQLSAVLDLPVAFFYRQGAIYQCDPRYPPDYFVPLIEPSVSRETIADMLRNVPDDELAALAAYIHSVAEYGAGIVKMEGLK